MQMVVGLDIITFVRIGAEGGDEVRDAFGSGDSRRLPLRICHRCSAVGKVHFFAARPVDARARQQAGDLSLVSLAPAAVWQSRLPDQFRSRLLANM